MANYPPPYPPPMPPVGPPTNRDLKYQRRMARDQMRAQREQYLDQVRGMRRSSILGPVLLILVGVVFLLVETGRLHSERLWGWYGRWWPLLLIAAGIVILVEWSVDRLRPRDPQQPYLRRTVGGDLITLIILASLFGAALSGIHRGHSFVGNAFSIDAENLEQLIGNKHESDETLVEQLPAGNSLSVDNPHGNVTITGTSTDGAVHISLHKAVYSHSDSDAERNARKLSPAIATDGGRMRITLPFISSATADLTLMVPAATAIAINANRGDVHIDHVNAPLTITANHGDVRLSAITGAIAAHVNNNGSSFSAHGVTGSLTIEGHAEDITLSDINGSVALNGDFYGTTHLEHITSAVKFHTSRTDFQLARLDGEMEISSDGISADQAAGPVVLTTANRNVTLERMAGDLAVTNRNGTVDLTSAPPLGNVTVQNRNGTVNVTLPDKANFAVDAQTTDGSIENDFSLPTVDHEQKATMTGTVGKGGPFIRINTSQGDVSFKKASIAPLPVKPPMPPMPPSSPQVSIRGEDGSSVYVGKDGVRITSETDGSSVVIGKSGLKITANADGSSVYQGTNGTRLTEGADGSKRYIGSDGTRFTEGADGSKTLIGNDGLRITIGADGSQSAIGSSGKSLNDDEIQRRLAAAEELVHRTEQRRDEERRAQQSRH